MAANRALVIGAVFWGRGCGAEGAGDHETLLPQRPGGLRGLRCELVAPTAAELGADRPASVPPEELAHKRQAVELLPSAGGEPEAQGFAAGSCVVGTWSLADTLPESATTCRAACAAAPECIGVLWGQVQPGEGPGHRCLLAGAGTDQRIVEQAPCKSLWGCPAEVTYAELPRLAPAMNCWQRLMYRCPPASLDLAAAAAWLKDSWAAQAVRQARLQLEVAALQALPGSWVPLAVVCAEFAAAFAATVLCGLAARRCLRRKGGTPAEPEAHALDAAQGVSAPTTPQVMKMVAASPLKMIATPMRQVGESLAAVMDDCGEEPTPSRHSASPTKPRARQSASPLQALEEITPHELALLAILNDGPAEDLPGLPGLGKISVEKIVAYRANHRIERLQDLWAKAGLQKRIVHTLQAHGPSPLEECWAS